MSTDIAELKRQAAERAVTFIESGMVVGLGTGSTAVYAVRALGRLLANGRLQNIVAIPTSEATAQQAREQNIPLVTLNSHPAIDLTIDGADEADPNLDLIKGLGGALLREKIVAAVSQRFIIIADESKNVMQLGSRAPVPVEVIPFAQRPVTDHLRALGGQVETRQANGSPFITDEGNLILDLTMRPIANPQQLAQAIRQQPGVVEHGLFLNMATDLIIATSKGIVHATRS